jgi:hypothetical protein
VAGSDVSAGCGLLEIKGTKRRALTEGGPGIIARKIIFVLPFSAMSTIAERSQPAANARSENSKIIAIDLDLRTKALGLSDYRNGSTTRATVGANHTPREEPC